MTPPTTVLVADDEALFRGGLSMIIEAQPDLVVVAEAADGAAAVEAVRRHRPDVVLMDIQMPVLDGIAATRAITAFGGHTRVIMLTTFGLDRYVYDGLRAGASGFLLKTVRPEHLVGGVRAVVAGDSLLAPEITRRLVADWVRGPRPGGPDPRLAVLTERETGVLRLVGRGLSNTEIAARLYLGEATVKTHVGRVLSKLGLRDRVQAVVLAYETGLVTAGRDDVEPGPPAR